MWRPVAQLSIKGMDLSGRSMREPEVLVEGCAGAGLALLSRAVLLALLPLATPLLLRAEPLPVPVQPWSGCRGCDLHGRDLRGLLLPGVDLRDADLSGADLRGSNLEGADLSGANLQGARLQGARLTNADLSDADLRDADLSDAVVIQALTPGARLEGAVLVGAEITGSSLVIGGADEGPPPLPAIPPLQKPRR